MGTEHGTVGAFSYDFTGQKCFFSSTSVLNTTLVPLWASKHRWSLCCNGFGEPVWKWSSRPHSCFTPRRSSDSKPEAVRTKSQDGIINFEYNHKAKRLSLLCRTELSLFVSKMEIELKGLWPQWHPAFPKAVVVWLFRREAASFSGATIWPLWCSSHKYLVCLETSLPLHQSKSLLGSTIVTSKFVSGRVNKLTRCCQNAAVVH